jgi:hypothetical protein
MSTQPPTPYLRASDADREAAVDRLRRASVEGRLDADELEDRLSDAYRARWTSDLDRLTADVTPQPRYPVPLPPPTPVMIQQAPRRGTNGLAVAALVAGVLGFMWWPAVAAIVFGHAALGQIKRSGGMQSGRGMAITGAVFGYLWVAGLIVVVAVHSLV